MLKRIPKSDISVRPFKAYKEWSFDETSNEVSLLEASVSSSVLSGQFPKNSIYGQLRAQFYNGTEDNPFLRTGHKTKSYSNSPLSKERFLSGSAKVISIPKIYVGEGIKKGSAILIDNKNSATEVLYSDDSFGNLQNDRDQIIISKIDVQNELINFEDVSENIYSGFLTHNIVGDFDIENNTLTISYNGIDYELIMVSMDVQTGIAIVENIPFLPEDAQGIKIGNIFYNQGLVVLTRDASSKLLNQWSLDYKSTQTIYEHEYLLIVNEDEFNVSTNPSAIVNIGKETGFVTGSDGKIIKVIKNTGVNYIRKKSTLENGNELDYRYTGSITSSITHDYVNAGFEHYELSSSMDSTGSFLSPFITTIGLYDDDCQLVAVAKLPQPIKSEPDIPVNFIIRFDT
jgi:hypothetical protein